jgi:hypothetical protein
MSTSVYVVSTVEPSSSQQVGMGVSQRSPSRSHTLVLKADSASLGQGRVLGAKGIATAWHHQRGPAAKSLWIWNHREENQNE